MCKNYTVYQFNEDECGYLEIGTFEDLNAAQACAANLSGQIEPSFTKFSCGVQYCMNDTIKILDEKAFSDYCDMQEREDLRELRELADSEDNEYNVDNECYEDIEDIE